MELKDITKISQEKIISEYLEVFNSEPWNDGLSVEEVENYIQNIITMNTFKGYVLMKGDNAVGFCLGFIKPWSKGLEYYMDTFLIFKRHQREGYGSLFLSFLKNEMKDLNIKAILLDTENDMPAYEFYLKNNFEALDGSVLMGINVDK